MNSKGFVSPSAILHGKNIHLGPHIFVDDHVLLFQGRDGGPIEIGAQVSISRNTIIDTSLGGSVSVGKNTILQPHCLLSAAKASIHIGSGVNIAPYCGFYPHNHGMSAGQAIRTQPLVVKGDIVVEDGASLGHGVTVLSGVRIGKGAVIGAGSTVASDVPDNAVAWGVPAKVFMKRKNAAEAVPLENTADAVKTNTGEGTP
jgi:acetyltransferase-like isoleucine patch superfamily enzyme